LDIERNTAGDESRSATFSIVVGVLVATATRSIFQAYGAPMLIALPFEFLSGGLAFLIGRAVGRRIEPRTGVQFWKRTETGVVILLGLTLLVSSVIYIQSLPPGNGGRLALALFSLAMLVVVVGVLRRTRTIGYFVLGLGAAQILGFFITGIPIFLSLGVVTSRVSILFFVRGSSLGKAGVAG
jgi:hypothetical protein